MKNIDGFIKLLDLNIPVIEYFDYYIEQLSKTSKFSDIKNFAKLWSDVEDEIVDIIEYRKSKTDEIVSFVKDSYAYNELVFDKNLIDYPTNKSIEYLENVKYFSIDLKNANWLSLKKYDPPHINQLGDSYEEFLSKFSLPLIFKKSKYLRQFILGNIDPKKLIKVQRNLIQEIVRQWQDSFKIEGVRNDEVIFSFENFEDIQNIINVIDTKIYKTKIFSVKRIENFRIDYIWDINGNLLSKELVGVENEKFYIKLKEYITGEKLDIKDLYFKIGSEKALWVIDNLKIEAI